jgi:hypothetical protein
MRMTLSAVHVYPPWFGSCRPKDHKMSLCMRYATTELLHGRSVRHLAELYEQRRIFGAEQGGLNNCDLSQDISLVLPTKD